MKFIGQVKRLWKNKRLSGFSGYGMMASLLVTCLTFLLLPLSQYAAKELIDLRPVFSHELPTPPQPKPKLEKQVDAENRDAPVPPKMEKAPPKLSLEALETALDVGLGDFLSEFALSDFQTAPGADEEFVFKLHELDRKPTSIKQGIVRYPAHLKKKGLQGVVKLEVQIDEKGVVRVQGVISSPHDDFIPPSVKAAENSLYTPPTRNGKAVKTKFVLPVNFTLTD